MGLDHVGENVPGWQLNAVNLRLIMLPGPAFGPKNEEDEVMKADSRSVLGMILVALVVALLPTTLCAEVTRVEITSRQDVLGGKAFGPAGA